jgi:histidine triad (HIT) family protein
MAKCLFCSIIARQAHYWPVYEDDATVAILDIAPATPAHTLVLLAATRKTSGPFQRTKLPA